MTIVLEKHIETTDVISGLREYINSFDPDLFVLREFATQKDADHFIVEIRLSTLKKIADSLTIR